MVPVRCHIVIGRWHMVPWCHDGVTLCQKVVTCVREVSYSARKVSHADVQNQRCLGAIGTYILKSDSTLNIIFQRNVLFSHKIKSYAGVCTPSLGVH